jgi:hypothetical protein
LWIRRRQSQRQTINAVLHPHPDAATDRDTVSQIGLLTKIVASIINSREWGKFLAAGGAEMKRSAIAIGVDRAGDLPVLKDAAAGARRFARWARQQQIECTDQMILTDDNGRRINIYDIKKEIEKITSTGTTEQLIIYFAGHGINIGYSEYWLLSDAPRDTQAAVNVRGSEELARYSGISHILFISDACRTAAEGVHAQRVSGGEIFPNEAAADLEDPVDKFFACTLGRPALEVRDPNTTSGEYSALYTTGLLDALWGREPELLEWTNTDQGRIAFVRPRPLKKHLSAAVPRRLADRNLQTRAIQVPDAHIVSDPTAWIARLSEAEIPPATRSGLILEELAAAPEPPDFVTSVLMEHALNSTLRPGLDQVRGLNAPNASVIAEVVDRARTPFGPSHFEMECGFKVRGAKFVEAFSLLAQTQLFKVPGEVVRVNSVDPPGASVLLVLESGNGIVVPALPDFVTALTIEDSELVDVGFESVHLPPDDKIRALHSVALASTRNGVFRLEGEHASAVADTLKNARGIDPTLAVYAAYAYSDFQRRDLIRETSECVRNRLGGAQLFDIALLAGELDEKKIGTDRRLLSFVPLLTQGWALLGAHRVELPGSLADLRSTVLPSVWTMFDEAGVRRIRAALIGGDVQ